MRRSVLIALPVVLVVVGGGAVAAFSYVSGEETVAAEEAPAATADVVLQDMARSETVDGTLSYGEVYTLTGAQPGTVTWLPEPGSVIGAGDAVYDVDNHPVIAMTGDLPLWRDLVPGVEGPDVAQLEQNLAELGYDGFTADDEYTGATAEAVSDWQEDNGLPETGTVAVGSILFSPDAVRVAEQLAIVGDPASGPIIGYTDDERQVALELEVGDQDLAEEGLPVQVKLPDGTAVEGEVLDVSTAVTAPPEEEGANASSEEDGTVEVTVAIADQDALGGLESAPVKVDLTTEVHEDVLVVPIEALLALRDGGYGLEVWDGSASETVPVETGIFAKGMVEVSGEGLSAGMQVGVPS
jgi:peptidoglycan hydrolase-like protein with peptidoglycan-binding domain